MLMKRKHAGLAGAVLLLVTWATPPALAVTPYRTESIVLLQPDVVFQERTPSVGALGDYIRAVQTAAGEALAPEPTSPASGFVVLAVRPGGRSTVWLDFRPALPEATLMRLKQAILRVPPFEARNGVVVFALNATLWDAPAAEGFPNPAEWRKAMEGHSEPMETGDLVDKVWP